MDQSILPEGDTRSAKKEAERLSGDDQQHEGTFLNSIKALITDLGREREHIYSSRASLVCIG